MSDSETLTDAAVDPADTTPDGSSAEASSPDAADTAGDPAPAGSRPRHPKAFYTAKATATGDGRNGHVRTDDGLLDLDLVIPNPITRPKKTNPEQLFASGFAACFNSSFQSAAKLMKVRLGDSSVHARVGIGPIALNRFGLGVRLEVTATGIDQETAERVAERAEQMCPYSNATRGNIPVELTVTVE